MELKGKKINFLGDSITQGHGVADPKNLFVNRIKEIYGLAEAHNYGIGGTRYARQQDPNDQFEQAGNFCKRLFDMDLDADAVVVFGGTNDHGHGDAPIGNFSDRTPDTFYGACHYIYSNLMSRFPTAQLAVLTPLHAVGETKPEKPPLKTYAEIIKEVAEYYAIPVLDTFAVSGFQPAVETNRQRYMPDGLHPNDDGHALLARKIGNFLLTL